MKKNQRYASISLDLDDQWSYMKIHGDKGWEDYPSYLGIFLPYVLDVLDQLELKITFFIVGRDAAFEKNRPLLREVVKRGHEIGNHSFHHESWLREYSSGDIEKEIELAEESIENATGIRPVGFRGPGFSWSADLFKLLNKKGYAFDASTLPTFIGPFARFYYFMKSNLSREERKSRRELFGSFRDGLRPVKPYYWSLGNHSRLLEIPVTTMPFFRIPFHMSYLLYISRFSMTLMKMYLAFSIFMCRLTRTSPSFLLHPLDLISGDRIPDLLFFPGMDIQSEKKLAVFIYAIKKMKQNFLLIPMGEQVNQLKNRKLNERKMN